MSHQALVGGSLELHGVLTASDNLREYLVGRPPIETYLDKHSYWF